MTPQIALSLFILALAILFFVTEWLPMEVVALLTLGTVALTGLVTCRRFIRFQQPGGRDGLGRFYPQWRSHSDRSGKHHRSKHIKVGGTT